MSKVICKKNRIAVLLPLASALTQEEYLYSAINTTHSLKALRHESHSFTCKFHHACLRKRSPDGATPNLGSRHPIAAYYLFINPEGMKG